ncbi:anthranilate phosphoribosyltransferase [Pontibacter qinzhouensis]|uniref:Anthranilate phosphoribosyltransferase n=1 Tax=Pontibacter qinzhouensis TaxID=2603253 RepID=A0A5C8K6W1_9BACT|nr:anthranilate phosphoribosyltransferase [Pontibacter qinzhouensis]TXK47931.1 anthranilate phosphoribosyltransferase [Pontibacter qinzhouensis]
METTQNGYTTHQNPLIEGIKFIGIGKHGSKPLPQDLLEIILQYLETEALVPIQLGAFFGALMAKGPTEPEKRLLQALVPSAAGTPDVGDLYQHLCPDAPANMQEIGIKLLRKEFLTLEEARELGTFLYADSPGESLRGMAASMLRIRYETMEEYQGLIEAATPTFTPGFKEPAPQRQKVLVQLAEPFDGVEHSYMVTPLLAQAFQNDGLLVISTVGRSSGPKLEVNAHDLFKHLPGSFITENKELLQAPPTFGWALDQKTLSPALDKWVDRRRLILKRPFLATSEKVLNPAHADILITSVFHITYMEKMINLAAMAGFKGVIILKRGLEGTLAPSLCKASGILCAALQADGSFKTQTFDADTAALAAYRTDADAVVEPLVLEDNLQHINEFATAGATGNQDFDKRVRLALALYRTGLAWVQQHWQV